MLSTEYRACLVIGGCHSLVMANKELVGDPLETASIHAIGWRFASNEQIARPLQVNEMNYYRQRTPLLYIR